MRRTINNIIARMHDEKLQEYRKTGEVYEPGTHSRPFGRPITMNLTDNSFVCRPLCFELFIYHFF